MYRYKNRMSENKTLFLFDYMLEGCDPYEYFDHENITYWSHVDDETYVIDRCYIRNDNGLMENVLDSEEK